KQHEFTSLAAKKQFTAMAFDVNNQYLIRPVAWSSSDASIVQVDALGNAVATGNGTAVLLAQLDGVTASASGTVRQGAARISLNATSITLQNPRDRFQLVATAIDANGNEIKGLAPTFNSSDTGVAMIEAGSIVAVNKGTASIVVSVGGLTTTVPVTVVQGTTNPPPPPPGGGGSSTTVKR